MSKAFVVRSIEGHYFSKQQEWICGKDRNIIYFAKHKDVALNQLIDITIKDVNVRAKLIECDLDEKARPIVEVIVQTDLFIETDEQEVEADTTPVQAPQIAVA